MFMALYPLRYVIAAGVILAAIGAFYWKAYTAGERHAEEKQQIHDNAAKDAANSVRNRDIGADPDKLLKDDPWLRK